MVRCTRTLSDLFELNTHRNVFTSTVHKLVTVFLYCVTDELVALRNSVSPLRFAISAAR